MEKRTSTVTIVLFLAVMGIFAVAGFYFVRSYRTVTILDEIESLSPDELTTNAIKTQRCQSLEKFDSYWLVSDCKDGVEFKLFLYGDSYQMGYCARWQTHREAFNKLKQFFGSPDCVDATAEDKKIEEEPWINKDYEVYSVCGLKVMFRDNCIISVIG